MKTIHVMKMFPFCKVCCMSYITLRDIYISSNNFVYNCILVVQGILVSNKNERDLKISSKGETEFGFVFAQNEISC